MMKAQRSSSVIEAPKRQGSIKRLMNQVRRSSATDSVNDEDAIERASSSLGRPVPKRGLFYSKSYSKYKEKRKNAIISNQSDDSSTVDDEIPLMRGMSRRMRRTSSRRLVPVTVTEPTNVSAYLAARMEAERPVVQAYNHNAALVAGLSKSHMLDMSLVGCDGISVGASRFVMACYSPVLEDMVFKGRSYQGLSFDKKRNKIVIDFCSGEVLKAAVYHCFSGEFPDDFNVESPNEGVARNLAQMDILASVLKLKTMEEHVYRDGRKLINKRPVLACAIFDELTDHGGDEAMRGIKRYALDTIREMPMDTLLVGGVQWMKETSIEAIMIDQDLDVDEFYMFKILKAWEKGATRVESDRLAIAQRLSQYIELKYIEIDLLNTQVKDSGYYDEGKILATIALIEESLANRDSGELERVLVEGAGSDLVNGIYVRVLDDIGLSEEEILFVKEAEDGYSDVGLYLWGTNWRIAMCADYSSCFYSCSNDVDRPSGELVPRNGWSVLHNGDEPAPSCTYLPNTRANRHDSDREILAPNLEEMIDPTISEKRRSSYLDRRNDTVELRRMTLEEMMNLPEDRGERIGPSSPQTLS